MNTFPFDRIRTNVFAETETRVIVAWASGTGVMTVFLFGSYHGSESSYFSEVMKVFWFGLYYYSESTDLSVTDSTVSNENVSI